MPEGTDPNASQDGNNNASGSTSDAGNAFKPITSQEDLNEALKERLNRERSKFADYDTLKTKAEQFDQLEAANKSEIERAADKAAAAERERDAAKAEALRWKVAAKHGISDEDADLFLTGTDEETLTKQAERLSERVTDRKKQGNHVPREGTTPRDPKEDEMRAFTRQLFKSAVET